MSDRLEEDLMEDLAYDEAEGASEMFDEGEEFEGFDAADEDQAAMNEFDEFDDGFEEGFEEEGFLDEGDYGDEADYGDEDSMEEAMAFALGAEDTDEFFRRAMRGIRRVGSVVGRVARTAAPIARTLGRVASAIPHPYAQIAGRALTGAGPVLNLLGRLRAEGASEEEAMDAFAEYAMYDESARPVLAGLAARTIVRARGARMPLPARRIVVHSLGSAARTLAQRRGPTAVRALPRIVRSVRRTAATRRTPTRAIPRIVGRTVANVARNNQLARRLSRPVPAAVRRVRAIAARPPMMAGGGGRSFTLRGPVRITISSAA
jgi:hypothetical protein